MITKYLKFIFSISLLFFFTMCNFSDRNTISKTSINTNLIEINLEEQDYENTVFYTDLFESIKIIPLETNSNCLIGQISEIEIYNDTIYILDKNIAKALFMFDKNGNFIKKIGSLGKGPGEYISPKSFTIDNITRQIKILDEYKVLLFSFVGI